MLSRELAPFWEQPLRICWNTHQQERQNGYTTYRAARARRQIREGRRCSSRRYVSASDPPSTGGATKIGADENAGTQTDSDVPGTEPDEDVPDEETPPEPSPGDEPLGEKGTVNGKFRCTTKKEARKICGGPIRAGNKGMRWVCRAHPVSRCPAGDADTSFSMNDPFERR